MLRAPIQTTDDVLASEINYMPPTRQCDLMILDGECRTSLGLVRNFVPRGLAVAVGAATPFAKAAHSRGVVQRFRYDAPNTDLDAMHRRILDEIRRLRPRVLMPVFDQGWSIVHRFYDEFRAEAAIVPNPGPDLYAEMLDKSRLARCALEMGVPIPKSITPACLEEAKALGSELSFPVLMKPPTGTAGRGIKLLHSQDELCSSLDHVGELPIIQEFIPGEDLELTILCDQGRPVAGHAYLALRNAPLPYGPPVACRSIRDDDLMDAGCRFLSSIKYHGVAHLDFRRDSRDGVARLLDFNARLAGTNDISRYSGVDFGFMLYQMALGEKIEQHFEYELDCEYRWLIPGELRHLAATPQKLRTIRQLLRWNNVGTDVDLRDPRPHVVAMMEAGRRLLH